MSIRVNDFQWEPGKNDAEHIKLLESSRDGWQKIAQKAIAKLKALSKEQEPPIDVSISSAIECLLHPQDADDSDMEKAINTAVRAMRLLKAQEPRVMTLEEIREGEVYWFDCPGNFVLRPVICNMYDRGDSSYLNFVWQHGNFSWKICEYGRTWRCWTSRPTDEQREATLWN